MTTAAVEERAWIGSLFNDKWEARTPVSWPNKDFEPGPLDEWARFSIIAGPSDRLEFGAGDVATRRVTGRVIVSIFVPKNTGDLRARELAALASLIFKVNPQLSFPAGRVIFRDASIRDIGPSGAHYQFNVTVPYQLDTL